MLLGAACCFALDRLFHCRPTAHAHGKHCYFTEVGPGGPSRSGPGQILLAGDLFHSVVDGSLIAGAYATSLPLSVLVMVAIVVHEIPRKCAIIFMLVHAGRTRGRALLLGAVSGLGVLGGAVVAWVSLNSISSASPVLLFGAAAIILYVAVVELMPILRTQRPRVDDFQPCGFHAAWIDLRRRRSLPSRARGLALARLAGMLPGRVIAFGWNVMPLLGILDGTHHAPRRIQCA